MTMTDPALTEEGEQEDISDPWPEEDDDGQESEEDSSDEAAGDDASVGECDAVAEVILRRCHACRCDRHQ